MPEENMPGTNWQSLTPITGCFTYGEKTRKRDVVELPSGGGGVDCLGDRFEADLAALKAGYRLDEMSKGAAKPIQTPDNQTVPLPQVAQSLVEAGALLLSA